MPISPSTIKRMTTVLLREREAAHVTRADILRNTADEMYDGFIKPIGKYIAPRIISRYGIDEAVWKLIQQRIKDCFADDGEQEIDNSIRDAVAAGMTSGGCSNEADEYRKQQDYEAGFYMTKLEGYLEDFDTPADLAEVNETIGG